MTQYFGKKQIRDRKMVSEFAGQSLLLVTLGLLFIDLVMHSGMVICHAQPSPGTSDLLINPDRTNQNRTQKFLIKLDLLNSKNNPKIISKWSTSKNAGMLTSRMT